MFTCMDFLIVYVNTFRLDDVIEDFGSGFDDNVLEMLGLFSVANNVLEFDEFLAIGRVNNVFDAAVLINQNLYYFITLDVITYAFENYLWVTFAGDFRRETVGGIECFNDNIPLPFRIKVKDVLPYWTVGSVYLFHILVFLGRRLT